MSSLLAVVFVALSFPSITATSDSFPPPPLTAPKIHQICYFTPFYAAGDKRKSGRPVMVPCKPADFGAVNSFKFQGQHKLVVADPEDACSEEVTCDGHSCQNRVVLIFRGGCAFYQKAKNLMRQKAKAIIIADNVEPTQGLITLVRGGQNIVDDIEKDNEIPVVSTTVHYGRALKELALGAGSHTLFAMEFSEFKSHSWKPKVEEFQIFSHLRSHPYSVDLWERLSVTLGEQEPPQQVEASKAKAYAGVLRQAQEQAKAHTSEL